jgi:hypothetical protein
VCFSIMEMEEEWPNFASWKAVMSLRGRVRRRRVGKGEGGSKYRLVRRLL